LGPTLVQLPPNFKKDLPRLTRFLELLPPRWRTAVEFRHPSWFGEDVFQALKDHNVALCVAHTGEEGDPPFEATADWGYLRLRGVNYSTQEISDWARRVTEQSWSDAFVFFKHEDAATGPKLAMEFEEAAGKAVSSKL